MGLFSSKKTTHVTSVVYPLGEDDGPKKQEFLKATVLTAVMTGQESIADTITDGYMRGQGMALRNCLRYAQKHYADGVPISAVQYMSSPDYSVLLPVLQAKHPGMSIQFLSTMVATADFEWWAEKYLAEEFGYDRHSKRFEFPPAGVDEDADMAYDLEANGTIRILLMNNDGGVKVFSFRPGSDYAQTATFVHSAYQGVQVFDNGTSTETRAALPGETDSVTVDSSILVRSGETQTTVKRTEVDVSTDGTTATVKISKTTEVRTRSQYFLYRLGSGTYPGMDAWLESQYLSSPYYPSVPLRLDNQDMLTEARKNTQLYKTGKKLLNRMGLDIDSLGENINKNDNVKDIDYAFVVFGVSLNIQSQEGRRYLFRFFEHLRSITKVTTTKAAETQWAEAYANGQQSAPPTINKIEIFSPRNRSNNYDVKIQWNYVETSIHSGVVFPGARKDDVIITLGAGSQVEFSIFGKDIKYDSTKLYARRQIDEDTYEELEIAGLVYENFIYQGKSITITAWDAFNKPDKDGFLVPLNQMIIKQMSLKDVTDLAYQCCYLVFNCYQVVKQKWYQTGWFKILLIIIAVVITIFFPPAGVTAMQTAMITAGIAVTLALVLSAIAYVVMGMVLSKILVKASTELFGEEWGAVIAIMAMFVAANWNSFNQISTTGITSTMAMQASIATFNAYGAWAGSQAAITMRDITKLGEEWDKKFNELEEMSEKMLGTNTNLLDIQAMTDATYMRYFESTDMFLSRTLLTGNNICELTSSQISNFTGFGLQLPTIG